MSIRIERHRVCSSCWSVTATDPECVCCYSNRYDTIELDFEVCGCCNNLVEDGTPAETEFNDKQLKNE